LFASLTSILELGLAAFALATHGTFLPAANTSPEIHSNLLPAVHKIEPSQLALMPIEPPSAILVPAAEWEPAS
jgi:hypothetical protein